MGYLKRVEDPFGVHVGSKMHENLHFSNPKQSKKNTRVDFFFSCITSYLIGSVISLFLPRIALYIIYQRPNEPK